MRALLKGNRRLGNFVISNFPPDFTEFLPSPGPSLPDLQGLHFHMAKLEYYTKQKNVESAKNPVEGAGNL